MGMFRRLPPEVLESLGLEPEGEEDEPDEPSGPYELPHLVAETSPPEGVAGPGDARAKPRRRRALVRHRP
jgi:hypothetical protein